MKKLKIQQKKNVRIMYKSLRGGLYLRIIVCGRISNISYVCVKILVPHSKFDVVSRIYEARCVAKPAMIDRVKKFRLIFFYIFVCVCVCVCVVMI